MYRYPYGDPISGLGADEPMKGTTIVRGAGEFFFAVITATIAGVLAQQYAASLREKKKAKFAPKV